MQNYDILVNERIPSGDVRLILSEGGSTVVNRNEAIMMARNEDMELVCVSNPTKGAMPVVKIVDYNNYLYEIKKKKKEAQKASRAKMVGSKEIKLTPNIAEHDIEIKANNIKRLVSENNKVMISVTYNGRMMRQIEKGKSILEYLAASLDDTCMIEREPKIVENRVIMTVAPSKKKG